MNILLLEFDTNVQIRTALSLIASAKLIHSIADFAMNTEHFAHFGLRFLEILSLQYPELIISSPGEILGIVSGLLRTNDYETCVASLSFVAVLCQSAVLTTDKNQDFVVG